MVVVSSGKRRCLDTRSHTLTLICSAHGTGCGPDRIEGQNRTMTVKIAGMGRQISKKEMTVSKEKGSLACET